MSTTALTAPIDLKTSVLSGLDEATIKQNPSAALSRLEMADQLREYAQKLARENAGLRNEKIGVLGDSEMFVRKDDRGFIHQLKAGIPLRLSQDHIYAIEERKHIRGKWQTVGRKWKITAAGYQFINTIAGIQLITPPRIEVEGRSLPNPYVVRHEKPGRSSALREVHVRTVAFGRAASGNLVMADSYLIWRPISYLTTSVVALTGRDNIGDNVFMGLESEFLAARAEGKARGMAWFPIEEAGDDMLGVVANVSHPDVVKQIKAHSERQKFGDRIARTICERNALKKLIGASTVNPSHVEFDGENNPTEAVAIIPLVAWAEPDSLLFKDGGVRTLLERAKQAENPSEVNALMEAAAERAGAERVEVRAETDDVEFDAQDPTLVESTVHPGAADSGPTAPTRRPASGDLFDEEA